ncbi:hypothetical protein CH330_09560 [candidate division WOR-3 bacterium JGI_Cruoil_03_51_56]|uniref:Mechanosensitive ion channel protein MscS n=1 Tax=candidate division WOR-3 bacterium JGI_Cruoil_03_51_56 TaxID=1973747 RepID=A0A235BNH7_UNCW3|nr:MAG: hypothetical protein CH330_09560 [candidate division WOR-3 bacterium JGI_Cruoil_03_51_56]
MNWEYQVVTTGEGFNSMFWHELWQALRERFFAPERLADYAGKIVQLILIVGIAWFVSWIIGKVVVRLLRTRAKLLKERRARTLISLSRSVIRYGIFLVALVMCLRTLGVDYSAILAGAGVVGLAVGFGAQTLVRDFLSGFFLLFEDSISVGDSIAVGDVSGTVEKIGLRTTQVRSFDGILHTVPNGELTRFGNRNRGFMRAIVTVDLAYEQDAERGMSIASAVAEKWFQDNHDLALEPPQVQGLLNFGESGLSIRVVVKVKPMRHWAAERDLRVRLKKAFDEDGVEVPFPRQIVYLRHEKGKPARAD